MPIEKTRELVRVFSIYGFSESQNLFRKEYTNFKFYIYINTLEGGHGSSKGGVCKYRRLIWAGHVVKI